MKKAILVIAMVMGLVSTANATEGNLTDSQVKAVKGLVVLYGYRCDSVNFAMRSNWDGSIRFVCNNNSYVYEVKDVGGNWTVKVK